MSKRDHYRGVPKTRDAVVTNDGKIKPLNIRNAGTASASAALFDRRHVSADDATTQVIYIRNTGRDTNDGLTEATALRTLQEATTKLQHGPSGKTRQVFEVTGLVDTVTEVTIDTPPGGLNSSHFGRPAYNENGRLDIFNSAFEMRADPILVQQLTVVGEVAGPTSKVRVLTVSETLIPSAHINQWVEGGANSFKWGVVVDNTANTVTIVSDATGFASATDIYTQSCILSSDDFALLNLNCNGSVQLTGIKIVNTNSGFQRTSLKYSGTGGLSMWFCDIDGLTSITDEGFWGTFALRYSHVYERFWPEKHAHNCAASVFTECTFSFHGSGGEGLNTMDGCYLDGCAPYGGWNLENAVDIEVNDCWVKDSTGHGIHVRSPFHARVSGCRIEGSTGDAIRVDCAGGYKHIEGNTGGSNSGYGLNLKHGAQAHNNGSNTVSGTSGQVKVGDNTVSLWADGETTDLGATNPQMCRIFTTY